MPSTSTPKVKMDLKKLFPDFYNASAKEVQIVDVPPMNYVMVDGQGDPNTSQEFQDAVGALYAVSYTLKMGIKKKNAAKDYVVPPLEGLWFMDHMEEWSMDAKNRWKWTIMIRVPDFIKAEQVQETIEIVKQKKNPPAIGKVRFETYTEGCSMQLLHIGPYDAEPPNIQKMHLFAKANGYTLRGKHHEIYLSDPRKAAPEKMRTVLRQPLTKKV